MMNFKPQMKFKRSNDKYDPFPIVEFPGMSSLWILNKVTGKQRQEAILLPI